MGTGVRIRRPPVAAETGHTMYGPANCTAQQMPTRLHGNQEVRPLPRISPGTFRENERNVSSHLVAGFLVGVQTPTHNRSRRYATNADGTTWFIAPEVVGSSPTGSTKVLILGAVAQLVERVKRFINPLSLRIFGTC